MFEEYAIRTDSLENTVSGGTAEGFSFAVRLPSDRGLWLSLLGGFYVCVDGGAPYPQSAMALSIGGKLYPVTELSNHPWERWGAFQEGRLYVQSPGGLPEGVHTIEFQAVLLGGYFKAREEWVQSPPVPGASGKVCRFSCPLQTGGGAE